MVPPASGWTSSPGNRVVAGRAFVAAAAVALEGLRALGAGGRAIAAAGVAAAGVAARPGLMPVQPTGGSGRGGLRASTAPSSGGADGVAKPLADAVFGVSPGFPERATGPVAGAGEAPVRPWGTRPEVGVMPEPGALAGVGVARLALARREPVTCTPGRRLTQATGPLWSGWCILHDQPKTCSRHRR